MSPLEEILGATASAYSTISFAPSGSYVVTRVALLDLNCGRLDFGKDGRRGNCCDALARRATEEGRVGGTNVTLCLGPRSCYLLLAVKKLKNTWMAFTQSTGHSARST